MANSEHWSELMEEFRCLWDPQHPKFNDETQRVQVYEQLLDEFNRRGSPTDMVTLKLWTASFHRYKTGRLTIGVCWNCVAKSVDIARLLPDFPCLWDFQDLNFSDNTVKDRCLMQLLNKYNTSNDREEIMDMKTLSKKLNVFNQNRLRCSRAKTDKSQVSIKQLSELLKDYPYLWDPRDLNYLDNKLKARGREQLLERYNAVSSTPLDMKGLRSEIKLLKLQRRESLDGAIQTSIERMAELIEEFPCLCDPRHPDFGDQEKKLLARKHLLEKYNAISSVPIDMRKLKRKIRLAHDKQKKKKSAQALDLTTTNLQHSEESQYSQTNSYSTEAFINEVPREPTEDLSQHSDHEMDSDIEYENDYKDIKAVPISVTDTEFIKRSINVCVKKTNEGKRRVYVDLNGCLSLASENDRNNDNEINRSIDSFPETKMDLANEDSDYIIGSQKAIDSGIDIADFSSFDNDRNDNAIDLAFKDRKYIISNEKTAVPATEALHSGAERTVSDARMGMFSESIGTSGIPSEMWYSVELPNIFR